jgi:glutathione S-transferase
MSSTLTLTAFRWVPSFAQGLVRDLRVRWALEEGGRPYRLRLIGPEDQSSPAYRALQPFGQVPAIEDGDLRLFESGAIVLHLAEQSPALLPREQAARLRARTWMFAALSTVEPPILALNALGMTAPSSEGVVAAREQVSGRVDARLDSLGAFLDGKDYLEGSFSAADLLMATVLRILRDTERVTSRPVLAGYLRRCEARPAFQKALDDQLTTFAENAPTRAS